MGSKDGADALRQGQRPTARISRCRPTSTPRAKCSSPGIRQAGMQAFMAGKVRVQGDMTKLMMAQAGGGGGANACADTKPCRTSRSNERRYALTDESSVAMSMINARPASRRRVSAGCGSRRVAPLAVEAGPDRTAVAVAGYGRTVARSVDRRPSCRSVRRRHHADHPKCRPRCMENPIRRPAGKSSPRSYALA